MIIIGSFGDKFCQGGKHIFTYLTRVSKAQKKNPYLMNFRWPDFFKP